MKFRDYDVEIPKPYHNGKQWIYDDTPTYQNLLDCFMETQRPEGEKKIREQYGNTRLRDPFRKINKMDLQLAFDHVEGREGHAYEVDWVENNDGKIVACILYYNMKNMKTQFKKIKSFTGAEYKLNCKTDAYIREIACYPGNEQHLYDLIKRHESEGGGFFDEGTTVVECDMQNRRMVGILRDLGYERRDNLITSFADMYGYWFKGEHTGELAKSQEISLQRLDLDVQDTDPLMEQIFALQEDFANHYSNYNKGNSWSGIVVRGYGGKEDFIIKPAEMNQKWRKENAEKLEWKVEDTPLRERLTEVEKFAKLLPFEHERIRILKLSQGEGELERHTDRQDVEAGIGDGQWARLHFPLKTNPKVEFTQWNCDGSVTKSKMGKGELWYLDMRKPHTAINFGEEDRYHLIIDVKSGPELRKWLVDSSYKYPSDKQSDWYVD
tara:strand:+ start:199 stop:1512 length:1314 start_codon:yes stop_codon:yes gene_type:complete